MVELLVHKEVNNEVIIDEAPVILDTRHFRRVRILTRKASEIATILRARFITTINIFARVSLGGDASFTFA